MKVLKIRKARFKIKNYLRRKASSRIEKKMEMAGFAAVLTEERPSLNEPPWLPPTSVLINMKRPCYL